MHDQVLYHIRTGLCGAPEKHLACLSSSSFAWHYYFVRQNERRRLGVRSDIPSCLVFVVGGTDRLEWDSRNHDVMITIDR